MDDRKSFFKAVCDGDAATVKKHLAASPGLVNTKDDGATPLHFAAINNQREVADLLIDQGADLNAEDDEFTSTPSGWANEKGYAGMVRRLVARGAKVDLPNAAAFGLVDLARDLLKADPSAVNAGGVWGRPIHQASVWGRAEIVELLLANGADPNLKNCDGRTALAIASHQVATNGESTSIAIETIKKEIVAGCARVVEVLKNHDAK